MAVGLQKKWEAGKVNLGEQPNQPTAAKGSNPMGVAVALNEEVVQLKRELADAQGRAVHLIDPKRARPSRLKNRHELSFKRPEYLELVESVRASGGNEQPAIVRPLEGDPNYAFEIIAGLRRHRAALETGTPFKVIIEKADDRRAYELMTRENSQRADLSPWEWGRFYLEGLSLYQCTQKDLAARVQMSEPHVVGCLVVGRLPDFIVAAFPTPLDIQLRWAQALNGALKSSEPKLAKCAAELVASRAAAIEQKAAPDAAPEVFRKLMAAAKKGRPKAMAAVAKPRAIQVGKIKGSIGVRGGKTVLELKTPLAPEKLDQLESFVRDLLASG